MRQTFSNPPPIMQYVAFVIFVAVMAVWGGNRAWGEEPVKLVKKGTIYWQWYATDKPTPCTVTAYRASDGELFESREEMEEHNKRIILEKRYKKLEREICDLLLEKEGPQNEFGIPSFNQRLTAAIIIRYYPEIKAIMEPKVKP